MLVVNVDSTLRSIRSKSDHRRPLESCIMQLQESPEFADRAPNIRTLDSAYRRADRLHQETNLFSFPPIARLTVACPTLPTAIMIERVYFLLKQSEKSFGHTSSASVYRRCTLFYVCRQRAPHCPREAESVQLPSEFAS